MKKGSLGNVTLDNSSGPDGNDGRTTNKGGTGKLPKSFTMVTRSIVLSVDVDDCTIPSTDDGDSLVVVERVVGELKGISALGRR